MAAPAPLAAGAATVTRLGEHSVDLHAARPGTALVRVRWTPYWALVRGAGCVERGADSLVRLRIRRPGELRLATRFSLGRVVSHGPRCAG